MKKLLSKERKLIMKHSNATQQMDLYDMTRRADREKSDIKFIPARKTPRRWSRDHRYSFEKSKEMLTEKIAGAAARMLKKLVILTTTVSENDYLDENRY